MFQPTRAGLVADRRRLHVITNAPIPTTHWRLLRQRKDLRLSDAIPSTMARHALGMQSCSAKHKLHDDTASFVSSTTSSASSQPAHLESFQRLACTTLRRKQLDSCSVCLDKEHVLVASPITNRSGRASSSIRGIWFNTKNHVLFSSC